MINNIKFEELSNVITFILKIIGIITIINFVIKILARFFDSINLLLTKIKIYFYYPILIRINKKKHKDYIEEYFNNLIFNKPIEWPIPAGKIRIEWSNDESVEVDLKNNFLLVRIEYAEEVEENIAKAALLTAPYFISEYLEPALGREYSRLISIGIIEDLLQKDLKILRKFKELVHEVYRSDKQREILNLITRADDTSLYKHVFLYEIRCILSGLGSRVDRDRLISELEELLRIIANLEEIDVPTICRYYIHITIVRAGVLSKIILEDWEPYVQYIRNNLENCPYLQHVYIVSAGSYTSRGARRLIKYLEENIQNIRLIDLFEYRARYYKGKTNMPCIVAVMKVRNQNSTAKHPTYR